MRINFKAFGLSIIAAVAAAPALAADAGSTEVASPFDIYFGTTFTSNYVSRGSTQTNDGPALQGYVELGYDMFYAGVWASNVVDDTEIDIYGGIRPEIGDLSLDFGFAQYVYPNDSTNYGEFYAKASYAFTEMFSAGTEFYYEPYAKEEWGVLNAAIALPEDFELSGAVGYDFQSGGRVAWDAGVSRGFFDVATLDLRYHDANDESARFVVSLSFDTSWSALRGK